MKWIQHNRNWLKSKDKDYMSMDKRNTKLMKMIETHNIL